MSLCWFVHAILDVAVRLCVHASISDHLPAAHNIHIVTDSSAIALITCSFMLTSQHLNVVGPLRTESC